MNNAYELKLLQLIIKTVLIRFFSALNFPAKDLYSEIKYVNFVPN